MSVAENSKFISLVPDNGTEFIAEQKAIFKINIAKKTTHTLKLNNTRALNVGLMILLKTQHLKSIH